MAPHRVAALSALGFLVLNFTLASLLVAAAYGFDLALFNESGRLVERGPGVAALLRVAMLIDMVGYLAFAPLALYLRQHVPAVVTAAGVGFAVIGAIGAATLGSVGPLLLERSAGGPEAVAMVQLQLAALEKLVFVGLWGTLELSLLAVWTIAVSWVNRQAESRWFPVLGGITGIGLLGYSLRCALTGETPVALAGPLDYLIVALVAALAPWMAWLTIRLWRGTATAGAPLRGSSTGH